MIKNINRKILISSLLVLTVGVASMYWVAQSADKHLREILLEQARIVAQAINVQRVASLSGSENDLSTPAYIRIKSQLSLMRNAIHQCRFLYLLGQRVDDVVFFFVDSLPVNSKDYAPPGLIYDEVSDSSLHIFASKKEGITGPVTDRWGVFITALVPISDPQTKKIIAFLGMDINVADWNKKILYDCLLPFVITLFFLLLILFLICREQSIKSSRESEKKFKNYVESSPFGIFIVDEKGNCIDVNTATCKVTGYSKDELLKKNILEMIPLEDQVIVKKHFELVANNGSASGSMHFIKKNKAKKIWLVDTVKLSNTRFLGFINDITKRDRRKKEKIKIRKIIAEQKKLALVGQIAGKIAHDFNNVLSIIMGNTEIALINCKDEKIKKILKLIFEQTIRGKNLTKNLVAFAKDQEPKQEFFRINKKIDLTLSLMKRDLQGIELIREYKAGVPELFADPGMIEHAFVNLIQNSIHAVSLVKYPKIISRIYSTDDNICIEIEDNGCGISKNHLENIFEPSFTLKGSKDTIGSYEKEIKGTGYGMTNVKKYIEQHKGSISVESELGTGTKITISLPIIKKELINKEKIEIQREKMCVNKSILLVEDETEISGVQYKILSQEPCNHKVDIANDGQVAMDLFKRNDYDLVSLDYALQGKIHGMDVYNHIRITDKTIPILFISGNIEFLESIKELKQKDVNVEHLSKPCQSKDYVNSINKLLKKM
ncbi:MAG: hypothetical protein B6I31_03290 [Desulfobacteraceae bacterium 4572_19]|nr:MAG: hypothetical protein B6I31_03290 [Desulfobacteraceae bacterium 4572_19]